MAYYDGLRAKWGTLPTPANGTGVSANLIALASATVTLANQPIPWPAAKAVARRSATGDWGKIVLRSRMTPTGGPGDAAILVAINAVESEDSDVLRVSDPDAWAVFVGGLQILENAGDLSAQSVAEITALAKVDIPWWSAKQADGGGELSTPPNVYDLIAAGLITEAFARQERLV
jgi:hypothetical protein